MKGVHNMAKCETCKKADVFETSWEKFTKRLMYFMFPKRIIELTNEKHLEGFGQGYKQGFQHAQQNQQSQNKNITSS